ncbi:stage II sporulation protein M [Oceanirhabdus sp. W0125-5]|uniref:stage II sporulation protein M n=1 Tax=Oceanirhabdus sp. W0125-5 TaxID=2999116 RepID=UPI0022F2DD28|nr:stage II sporulation protein M [Oceanirhabdus sp. W0125-5]WBW95967.1 stage II sporulation protein M [Oceanirhabdus sp. W0125-5]
MKKENFINIHKPDWDKLSMLTEKIQKKGFKSLDSQEVKNFLHLFRLTSHNLSYSKTHYGSCELTTYLNSLIGRSHNYIYSVKRSSFKELLQYFTRKFPALLKEHRKMIFISTFIFLLGFIISFLMVYFDKSSALYFLPAAYVESASQDLGSGAEWNAPMMSSFIMLNNITVSFKAFVFGITLGLGTIYVLFMNGALLGALASLVFMQNNNLVFWSLILPHGVIELTAIFIAGGAGLIIGKSIINPGDLKRKDSIIKGCIQGASLLGGVCFLLVIAGIIEGFFTPLKISPQAKLIFALMTAVVLGLYFLQPTLKKKNK